MFYLLGVLITLYINFRVIWTSFSLGSRFKFNLVIMGPFVSAFKTCFILLILYLLVYYHHIWHIWVLFTSFSYVSHLFPFFHVFKSSIFCIDSLATCETIIVLFFACFHNFLSSRVIFIHLGCTAKWFYLVLTLV
jgi:hypothetical protein